MMPYRVGGSFSAYPLPPSQRTPTNSASTSSALNAVETATPGSNTEAVFSGAVRWPSTAFPLRVQVIDSAAMTASWMVSVMQEWEQRGCPISFVYDPSTATQDSTQKATQLIQQEMTGQPTNAPPHIVVCWRDTPPESAPYAWGDCQREVNDRGEITKATITLVRSALTASNYPIPVIRARIMTALLHETGHALGLEHSTEADSIMLANQQQQKHVSPNDLRAVRLRYTDTK